MDCLRILIWSLKGSGEHYSGPGMSIYRTYYGNKGDDVSLLLLHGYPEQQKYSLFSEIVEVFPVVGKNFNKLRQIVFIIKGFIWLFKNRSKYDVFFGLTSFLSIVLPAYFVKKIIRKPSFVRVAATDTDLSKKNNLSDKLGLVSWRRKAISSLNGVISISSDITRELKKYGVPEDKIFQIPNGVDTLRFTCSDKEFKKEYREKIGLKNFFTVIFVGSLVKRKQPHLAIEAIRKCLVDGVKVQLLLLGPSPEPDYFNELKFVVNKYHIDDYVFFREFTHNPVEYYHASDVFVLPSMKEGMSNAMLEAAASGLPVIVGDMSGARDILGKGCGGRMVNVSDEFDIARHITIYANDEKLLLRDGRASRNVVEKYFSSSFVYNQQIRIFKSSIM